MWILLLFITVYNAATV